MKFRLCIALFAFGLLCNSFAAETFRVATYNVENYLDQPTESRHFVKSAEAKTKVRESIEAMNPDVIALEEMGTTNALLELRASLKNDGQDFPFCEHVQGADTNIHVAVLSKFPIVARHPHTNDEFLLDGRRFRVERGFAEVEIQAATNFTFTLIAAHLKSRRPVPDADEAEERLAEAKVLRGIIDEHFKANPNAKLVVLGDFNDTKNSDSTKEIIGRGKFKLTDTRPAERNGDDAPNSNPKYDPRTVTWTYHYGLDDTYSRIDYILLSPAMARDWVKTGTYIPTIPNWGNGSDHRPIVTTFEEK
ncbi:MAG TPA: endonuclease/exonuclease/phosphatase family protein [Verrucomicrobiae bacterium]|jgi:endonuclease/exonuclease/phosphatase family metal-dependent hydrolase|nr:endonuclease/exonuclease/phosphatase family protein [Verrucomicrobiae bacterium]